MIVGKKIFLTTVFSLLFAISAFTQSANPDLLKASGVFFDASSTYPTPPWMAPPWNIAQDMLQLRWEANEKEGAWIQVNWEDQQEIKELWIINKAVPFDFKLDPYMRTANYLVPRNISLEFSNGTSVQAELRLSEYYQILSFPEKIVTNSLKISIDDLWENSGEKNTGLCKVKAFSKPNPADFKVEVFEMYNMLDEKPVQSAKIEILNPGNKISDANLVIRKEGKVFGTIKLAEIPATSVSIQQVWIPLVYADSELTFSLNTSDDIYLTAQTLSVKAYNKSYFDGGTFNILNTNHNDLGWLNTQAITADYRSTELILPAMDLMKKHPEFKYTMESIEYLKEFLERHPERKEEMARLLKEKRFVFGASYIQALQVHVGPEKLVRQFYYGRRWLLENFPGCDTRFYMNTDVPGFTYQLPQILKKSGIDYMIQGRMAWGFYNWEGLDGTSIPMFAFRYAVPYGLMNPVNNTGWIKFMNEREYYYKPRQLPKSMIYDFNTDYMPPSPEVIPFAQEQNQVMKQFATAWNENFKSEPEKQIDPPKIRFVEAEGILSELFGNGTLNVETLKGDWPMTWAYFDEPGNREALLMGRKGHNKLVKAEGLHSWLEAVDESSLYPKEEFEKGWLANCWPDHGWGGNRGIVTDSFYRESYKESLQIGEGLINSAEKHVLNLVPQGSKNQIPVVVYNSRNWKRTEITSCIIHYPKNWKGLEIKDGNGNLVPVEVINHSPEERSIELAFLTKDIAPFGFASYFATKTGSFPEGYRKISPDSCENDFVKVTFGPGGISSFYDKVQGKEILRTDKFYGAEVIQMTAPDMAWESYEVVNMENFDKTSMHDFKTIRAVESPIRYIIEKEAEFKNFTLRQRFILNKHSRELVVEADVLNWNGEKDRELRILFPVNMDHLAQASYEIPYGTVEVGRDEIDYSYLPDNHETQFNQRYARKDLPFREAVNWVDVSAGKYKGNGCLFASDMTVHQFRDETSDPVDYPIVQHVMLASRISLAWNPDYWFTQAGDHSYRMALYPHEGNWRFAYKKGIAFNSPLVTYAGKGEHPSTSPSLPLSESLLSFDAANIVVTALKQGEDGDGLFLRFYEAEGRYTKVNVKGFQPFSNVFLTDMIEYNTEELPVQADGSIEISVKPWEIVNVKIANMKKYN